jgi:hypothetical protein
MGKPLALVLGCERSGTSTVARILDDLGFCMGHDLPKPDRDNDRGYFEDRLMLRPSIRLAWGETSADVWLRELALARAFCTADGWGVKHPALSNVEPKTILELNPVLIAVTVRRRDDVVRSLERTKHNLRPTNDRTYTRRLWEMRARGLSRIVSRVRDVVPTVVIHMTERVPEEEIRRRLLRAG